MKQLPISDELLRNAALYLQRQGNYYADHITAMYDLYNENDEDNNYPNRVGQIFSPYLQQELSNIDDSLKADVHKIILLDWLQRNNLLNQNVSEEQIDKMVECVEYVVPSSINEYLSQNNNSALNLLAQDMQIVDPVDHQENPLEVENQQIVDPIDHQLENQFLEMQIQEMENQQIQEMENQQIVDPVDQQLENQLLEMQMQEIENQQQNAQAEDLESYAAILQEYGIQNPTPQEINALKAVMSCQDQGEKIYYIFDSQINLPDQLIQGLLGETWYSKLLEIKTV